MNSRNFKITLLVFSTFAMISCASNKQEATTEQASIEKSSRSDRRPKNQGQRERPVFGDLLSKMDANKDGLLSSAEVDGPLKEMFSKVDTNGDGNISEEEFSNMPPPSRGRGDRQ